MATTVLSTHQAEVGKLCSLCMASDHMASLEPANYLPAQWISHHFGHSQEGQHSRHTHLETNRAADSTVETTSQSHASLTTSAVYAQRLVTRHESVGLETTVMLKTSVADSRSTHTKPPIRISRHTGWCRQD